MRKDFPAEFARVLQMAKPLRGCASSGVPKQISEQVQNVMRCINDVLEDYIEDAAEIVRDSIKTTAVTKGVSFDVSITVEFPVELYRAFCILVWPASAIDPRVTDWVAEGHDLPDALSAPLAGHKGMYLTRRVAMRS